MDWAKQEAFNSLKPILPRHTAYINTAPPNPSLTILLAGGNQVLKDKNLWEPLLVKFSQNAVWIELCFKPNWSAINMGPSNQYFLLLPKVAICKTTSF